MNGKRSNGGTMDLQGSGVLLHPSSLYNPYPIGDLGPAAAAFVDFMSESGQRWWQMLPIGPTGAENSPYQSPSAFAGNPLLVSPERLMEKGYLEPNDLEVSLSARPGKVDFPEAARLKNQWLKKSFGRFEKNRKGFEASAFEAFTVAEAFWLEDFSLFSAIRQKEGTADWTRWDPCLRTRQSGALIRARKHLEGEIRYHQFVQWQFAQQWKELRSEEHTS